MNKFANFNPIGLKAFCQIDDFAHRNPRAGDGVNHFIAAFFNPFGDLDFTLASQQRHGAHFAQIHAHGIVCFANILGLDRIFQRARFHFGFQNQGGTLRVALLFTIGNFYIHLIQQHKNIVELIGRDHIGRQRIINFVIIEIAFFFA